MEISTDNENENTIQSLQKQLSIEKEKTKMLEERVLELKQRIIDLSTRSEAEEEAITLKLMRRMDQLKKEKEDLMKQVDIEEDHIANTLLKRLDTLQKEKVALEQKLEYEQECMVNRLQRQIQAIHREKVELRSHLRDDTQLLIRTIKQSIDIIKQVRSASATPALEPHPIDVPAEMEEVRKRLQPFSLPSPKLIPLGGCNSGLIRPPSPHRDPQDMMMEGEKKMKELLQVVNGMERTLNSPIDMYEVMPPMPTYLGGVALDDPTTRLRTGSIASSRSRSGSLVGNRDRSRHASISE